MKKYNLDNFTRGWFIGAFEPTIANTKKVEVAVKRYHVGDSEKKHYHKIAREITAVVKGRFKMNDMVVKAGDIIEVEPGETVRFECLETGANVVIKIPSTKRDKYEI